MKSPRTLVLALGSLAVFAAQAFAASTTYLIDFGAPHHKPYEFKAGDFGLKTPPTVITEPKSGDYEGFAFKDLVYQIGFNATLTFPKVGGYNLNETAKPISALTGSFIFSSKGRETVGSPVAFTLTTKSPADKITLSAIGGVQENNRALIIINGNRTVVDSSEEFVPVVKQLTGKTSYTATFETEDGEGEANIGGFLITIETR